MSVNAMKTMLTFLIVVPIGAMVSTIASAAPSWPCVGRPAIAEPGGAFALSEGVSGSLGLVTAGEEYPLTVEGPSTAFPGAAAVARVPEAVPAGRYELVLHGAEGGTRRPGAVHILSPSPEGYSVALVRADGTADGTEGLFTQSLRTNLVASSPDLIFVVGQLTTDGTEAAYRALSQQFEAVLAPVFFCPDREELDRGAYINVFGNPVYGFSYGHDGYLMLGAGPAQSDSSATGQLGLIHRWRRVLRASRWSTGVAGSFGLDWIMRSQLVLFVDDPLDYLLAGDVPSGSGERLPWGRTRFAIAPSIPPAPIQWIEVDESAMTHRPAVAPESSAE